MFVGFVVTEAQRGEEGRAGVQLPWSRFSQRKVPSWLSVSTYPSFLNPVTRTLLQHKHTVKTANSLGKKTANVIEQ